jgi:hypothetical protein
MKEIIMTTDNFKTIITEDLSNSTLIIDTANIHSLYISEAFFLLDSREKIGALKIKILDADTVTVVLNTVTKFSNLKSIFVSSPYGDKVLRSYAINAIETALKSIDAGSGLNHIYIDASMFNALSSSQKMRIGKTILKTLVEKTNTLTDIKLVSYFDENEVRSDIVDALNLNTHQKECISSLLRQNQWTVQPPLEGHVVSFFPTEKAGHIRKLRNEHERELQITDQNFTEILDDIKHGLILYDTKFIIINTPKTHGSSSMSLANIATFFQNQKWRKSIEIDSFELRIDDCETSLLALQALINSNLKSITIFNEFADSEYIASIFKAFSADTRLTSICLRDSAIDALDLAKITESIIGALSINDTLTNIDIVGLEQFNQNQKEIISNLLKANSEIAKIKEEIAKLRKGDARRPLETTLESLKKNKKLAIEQITSHPTGGHVVSSFPQHIIITDHNFEEILKSQILHGAKFIISDTSPVFTSRNTKSASLISLPNIAEFFEKWDKSIEIDSFELRIQHHLTSRLAIKTLINSNLKSITIDNDSMDSKYIADIFGAFSENTKLTSINLNKPIIDAFDTALVENIELIIAALSINDTLTNIDICEDGKVIKLVDSKQFNEDQKAIISDLLAKNTEISKAKEKGQFIEVELLKESKKFIAQEFYLRSKEEEITDLETYTTYIERLEEMIEKAPLEPEIQPETRIVNETQIINIESVIASLSENDELTNIDNLNDTGQFNEDQKNIILRLITKNTEISEAKEKGQFREVEILKKIKELIVKTISQQLKLESLGEKIAELKTSQVYANRLEEILQQKKPSTHVTSAIIGGNELEKF